MLSSSSPWHTQKGPGVSPQTHWSTHSPGLPTGATMASSMEERGLHRSDVLGSVQLSPGP